MLSAKIFDNPKRLYIPGYTLQDKAVNRQIVFPPESVPDGCWYSTFRNTVVRAIEKRKFLPVFRSGHGEYLFALGRLDRPHSPLKLARYFASRLYNGVKFKSLFYSGTPEYGYETYPFWRIPNLRRRFRSALELIHAKGVHCLYLSDRDACSLERQSAYIDWISAGNPFQGEMNYGHVYFVYALLLGVDSAEIIKGRRILVVTSNIDRRKQRIGDSLTRLGAVDIEFAEISRNHAMQDTLPKISGVHDLALIGGGVGAANILAQLSRYKALAIDAGYALDCFENPLGKRGRIYCVNDNEWGSYYKNTVPEWAAKFSDINSQLNPQIAARITRLC